MKKNKERVIEKTGSIASSASGVTGFLGGYQVCHNLCLGVVFLLSLIGITLVGMPLLFLTKVAIPFWIAAVILFGITLGFYFKNRCIPKNLLLFNAGIIIASIPFNTLKDFMVVFWIIGGSMMLLSIALFIKNKLAKNGRKNAKRR